MWEKHLLAAATVQSFSAMSSVSPSDGATSALKQCSKEVPRMSAAAWGCRLPSTANSCTQVERQAATRVAEDRGPADEGLHTWNA